MAEQVGVLETLLVPIDVQDAALLEIEIDAFVPSPPRQVFARGDRQSRGGAGDPANVVEVPGWPTARSAR